MKISSTTSRWPARERKRIDEFTLYSIAAADEAVADAKEKAHPGGRHLELTVGAGGDLVLVDDLNSGSRLRASAISFTEVAGNSLLLAPAAAPSIHEAVIDVGYVFKHLPEFQRLKKSLQQKIETQDREIREEKQALQGLTGKLKQESLAPVRENIEDEIAGRHAKMQAEMAGVRRRLKTEEAKIYVAVYKKVRQAIADHAKENNIQIVRRATTSREQKKKLESGDPQAVMQAMNEQVLYIADDSIDITDAVLERLKKEDDSSDNVEN